MPHSLAPYCGTGYFDPTLLTGYAFKADVLILSAIALPVFGRTEDRLAEKAILLWSQASIVDRFWFQYLAVRPTTYCFR
jgi:hypothetical protein